MSKTTFKTTQLIVCLTALTALEAVPCDTHVYNNACKRNACIADRSHVEDIEETVLRLGGMTVTLIAPSQNSEGTVRLKYADGSESKKYRLIDLYSLLRELDKSLSELDAGQIYCTLPQLLSGKPNKVRDLFLTARDRGLRGIGEKQDKSRAAGYCDITLDDGYKVIITSPYVNDDGTQWPGTICMQYADESKSKRYGLEDFYSLLRKLEPSLPELGLREIYHGLPGFLCAYNADTLISLFQEARDCGLPSIAEKQR